MRIISYNVNGIRSAINKGLMDWLASSPGDVICLQEIKVLQENIDHKAIEQLGFEQYWFPAQKKGYSGVAVFSRTAPDKVTYGTGHTQSDFEGRVLRLDFGDVSLINAYFPSGTSGEVRQAYKYVWLDEFMEHLGHLRSDGRQLIVCGDYNICHKPIDIHDPVSNKKSSGFLPEERAWMDRFMDSGFVDTFRHFNPDPHHYSWWSYRAAARERNKGWRIDYINVTEDLKGRLRTARLHPDVVHSDHCPVYLEMAPAS